MAHVLRAVPGVSRVLSASAHAALLRAGERIREAEHEAESIRARAREDASGVERSARAEGFARGRAEAGAVLLAAAAERDRLLAGAGREVVALALEVARKVLGEEVRASPERVAGLAARALRCARDARSVVVRVSAADAARVREALAEGVEVVADPDVPDGGCALDTPAGRIEASLEAQLEEIARALRGEAQ